MLLCCCFHYFFHRVQFFFSVGVRVVVPYSNMICFISTFLRIEISLGVLFEDVLQLADVGVFALD